MWWPAAFTGGGLVVTNVKNAHDKVRGQERQVEQFVYSCVSCVCEEKKGVRGHCIVVDKILKPFIVRLVHFRLFIILKQVLTGVFLPMADCVRRVSCGGAAVSVNVEWNLWTHKSVWTLFCSTNCLRGARATPSAPVLYTFIWQDDVFHPGRTTLRFQNFSTFPRWFSSRWTSESFAKFKKKNSYGVVGIKYQLLYISGRMTSSHSHASSHLEMWWSLQWPKSIHSGS